MIPEYIGGYHRAEWAISVILVAMVSVPIVVAGASIALLPESTASIVISTTAIIIASISLWLARGE